MTNFIQAIEMAKKCDTLRNNKIRKIGLLDNNLQSR